MRKNRRVVVTGVGVVTSIGEDIRTFWTNLIGGKSGISRVESFDLTGFRNTQGGEIHNFQAEKYMPKKNARRYGRGSQFAIAASKMACNDAGLVLQEEPSDRVVIAMGTTMANIGELEALDVAWVRYGESGINRNRITRFPGSVLAYNVSSELGIDSKCMVIPTACSAGNYCIGYGYDMVSHGLAETAICGGADSFSRITFTGFNSLFAMAPERCQPFDRDRQGMLVGEGAGVLVLEPLTKALSRQANIYAEIKGYGLSCDAAHMTLPNPEGVEYVMRSALAEAGLRSEQIDYISAHGTGTKANDATESQAINRVFSGRKERVAVSSIKSMLGHTMGAASAIEAISCVLSIRHSIIPPTINYEAFDSDCDLDCVPNVARERVVNYAMNNSFAFGGNNACVVFAKVE